jgi:hypothetical protein
MRIFYSTIEKWPVLVPVQARPERTRQTIEVPEETVQRWRQARRDFDDAQQEMRTIAAQQGVYDPTDM